MILTITGDIASGKSTVARLLADRLAFKRYSSGDFFRAMAQEQKMDLIEFSHMAQRDGGTIDREIDNRQRRLGEVDDNFVIDGRLSFRFIPHSFKIRLTVHPDEASRRIYGDHTRGPSDTHPSLQAAHESMLMRRESEKKRYMDYYQVDVEAFTDEDFDITIDTTRLAPEKVTTLILQALENYQQETPQQEVVEALFGLIARRRTLKYHNNEVLENIVHQVQREASKLAQSLTLKDEHRSFDDLTDTLWAILKLTDAFSHSTGITTNRLFTHAFHKYSERMPYLLSEEVVSVEEAQRIWDEVKEHQKAIRMKKRSSPRAH